MYAGKEYSTFVADDPIDVQVRRAVPEVSAVPFSGQGLTLQSPAQRTLLLTSACAIRVSVPKPGAGVMRAA
jgi:hypothetical protein